MQRSGATLHETFVTIDIIQHDPEKINQQTKQTKINQLNQICSTKSLSNRGTYLHSCSIPSAVLIMAAELRLLVTCSTFSRQVSMVFKWQLPPLPFLRLRERFRLFFRVLCASANSVNTNSMATRTQATVITKERRILNGFPTTNCPSKLDWKEMDKKWLKGLKQGNQHCSSLQKHFDYHLVVRHNARTHTRTYTHLIENRIKRWQKFQSNVRKYHLGTMQMSAVVLTLDVQSKNTESETSNFVFQTDFSGHVQRWSSLSAAHAFHVLVFDDATGLLLHLSLSHTHAHTQIPISDHFPKSKCAAGFSPFCCFFCCSS